MSEPEAKQEQSKEPTRKEMAAIYLKAQAIYDEAAQIHREAVGRGVHASVLGRLRVDERDAEVELKATRDLFLVKLAMDVLREAD